MTANQIKQNTPNKRSVRFLMFDVSSDGANFWFDISNVILFAGAVLVAMGTYGTIKFSGIKEKFSDERIAANELETKRAVADSDLAKQGAAEANARAAEAQLALEKFKAPRSISVEARNRIAESLKEFSGQQYYGMVASDVADAWDLWREISLSLELAGWKRLSPPGLQVSQYGPPAGIPLAPQAGGMILGSAGKSTAEETMVTHERAEALAASLTDESVIAGPGFSTDIPANTIAIVIGPKP
jgi:hypothetical protein